ncbi:MAG TPA: tetratricopeptide repeat protein [Hyphomicrobiales bacterium]|nr:tetratricopeptide repeat protein [Hyphomicrobiales bacterium]
MTLHLSATPAIAATVLSLLASLPLNAEIDPRRLSFHPEPLSLATAPGNEPSTADGDMTDTAQEAAADIAQESSTTEATDLEQEPSFAVDEQAPLLTAAIDTVPQTLPLIPASLVVANAGAATFARIQQRIAELEQREGQYAPALADLHDALARLYLAQDEPEAGLAAFEQARQIVRINSGLYSAAQVPLLREIIALNLNLGHLEQATAQQEALFNLQLRQYGRHSLDAVPALLEWADWNVHLYLNPQVQRNPSISIAANIPGTLGLDYRNPTLQEAYDRYVSALEILHEQDNPRDARLVEIEHKLAALNFMANRDLTTAMDRMPLAFNGGLGISEFDRLIERGSALHFLNGSAALKRAVAYASAAEPPDYALMATRLLELGDWYLLFNRRSSALETYQQALDLLEAAAFSPADIERVVASGMPVHSPDTVYQVQPAQYLGYIDVAFTLDKYGAASNPRILGASPEDAGEAVERALLQTIRSSRFRPRFEANAPVGTDTVQLRYFYAQGLQ